MTLPRKRLLTIAVTILSVLLIGWGAKAAFFPAKKAAPAVATAAVGDVEQTVLATGTLEPVELVSVGAQVSGQVVQLAVQLGQQVRKGELIAQIDPRVPENTLRTAQASLANVRAQRQQAAAALTQAQLAFRRQTTMLSADATARSEFEAADAALKNAKGALAAIEAQIAQAGVSVETAQVNLGFTRILAPMDGTILAIVTQQGQTVNANQAAPTIVKMGRLDTMTIKAEISEADVVKVSPGQDVYFTILGEPNKRRYAKLRTVEPAPESIETETSSSSTSSASTTAVYYNGLFDTPNPDGKLRTYMTAQVTIVLAQAKGAVTIPASALGRAGRGGAYEVQVMDKKGKIEKRQVRIGLNDNTTAQVLSGLQVGEQVVVGEAAPAGQGAAPGGFGGAGGRRGPGGPMGF